MSDTIFFMWAITLPSCIHVPLYHSLIYYGFPPFYIWTRCHSQPLFHLSKTFFTIVSPIEFWTFLSNFTIGITNYENPCMNLWQYPTNPKNPWIFEIVVGLGQFTTTSILHGPTTTPWVEKTWPKNFSIS